jgi:hypothetical protein
MSDPNKTWLVLLQKHEVHGLLQLPQGLAERPWAPTPADRKAAWWLYSELRTRITTQSLDYRAGDETTALASFHSLFATTRKILHKYPLCCQFGLLADLMLSRFRLRPAIGGRQPDLAAHLLPPATGENLSRSPRHG